MGAAELGDRVATAKLSPVVKEVSLDAQIFGAGPRIAFQNERGDLEERCVMLMHMQNHPHSLPTSIRDIYGGVYYG